MNEKERLLLTLTGEEVDRPPCACPLQTGTVDLMQACGAFWPLANHDPVLMGRLARSAHDLAGIESVRVPFDVTVDASAFGAGTGHDDLDRQPAIIDIVLNDPDSIMDAQIPDPLRDGRSPVVIKAIRSLFLEMDDVPIIGAIVAPFMLSAQLRGTQNTLMDVVTRPDAVKDVLEKATAWNIEYAQSMLDSGADVITLIDATASGNILGPSQYAEFALPYQKEVIDAIRNGGGKSILHICGDTYCNMPLMAQAGADGISVDQCMDIGWVKRILDGKAATVGNVNPTTTLLFGTPEMVAEETNYCLNEGTDVLAPGCGFAPRTPLANMKAMTHAAKRRGRC